MGNKKEGIIEDISFSIIDILYIVMIIIVAGLLIGFLLRDEAMSVSYTDVCKYNYGENYTYGLDKDFGRYCVELIYENHTKINYKKFCWSDEEIYDMCQVPGFWELDRWDHNICREGE